MAENIVTGDNTLLDRLREKGYPGFTAEQKKQAEKIFQQRGKPKDGQESPDPGPLPLPGRGRDKPRPFSG